VLTNRISSSRMKQLSDSFYSLFVVRTKSRPCPHRFLVPQSRALTSFLGCPLTKDIVNILYTMIFTTTVIKKLSLLLPFFGSATESTETDLEPPGPGDTPVQHGSFEWFVRIQLERRLRRFQRAILQRSRRGYNSTTLRRRSNQLPQERPQIGDQPQHRRRRRPRRNETQDPRTAVEESDSSSHQQASKGRAWTSQC
jgi:hypothetical protein